MAYCQSNASANFWGVCVCVFLQLPRAVNTQALSGAGFLKMINKASDAVNKMTIKMNESDTVRILWMKCCKTFQQTMACLWKYILCFILWWKNPDRSAEAPESFSWHVFFLLLLLVVWGQVPGGGEWGAAAEEASCHGWLSGQSQEGWDTCAFLYLSLPAQILSSSFYWGNRRVQFQLCSLLEWNK